MTRNATAYSNARAAAYERKPTARRSVSNCPEVDALLTLGPGPGWRVIEGERKSVVQHYRMGTTISCNRSRPDRILVSISPAT